MKTYPIKRAANAQALLNLACGTRTSHQWNNLDFSPYALLARHRRLAGLLRRTGLISPLRYQRLMGIDPDIVRHDLRKGIPYPPDSFDAVYSSHFLEHLPPAALPGLLRQIRTVLKPGGIIRTVVPDLELIVGRYVRAMQRLDDPNSAAGCAGAEAPAGNDPAAAHEQAVAQLFDQFIPHEGAGTASQRPWRRRLERLIRGDSARTGQLHQWMYDRHSLARRLAEAGFADVRVESAHTSRIRDWPGYHLDVCEDGSLYNPNPGSLYIEAVRPPAG